MLANRSLLPSTRPRRALVLVALTAGGTVLPGCWDLERSSPETERYPWRPDPGVPEGWSVERIDSGVRCPRGAQAPLFVVSPDAVDPRVDEAAPRLPVAVIYTSGAFDYVLAPPDLDPLSGDTWRESEGDAPRLGVEWAADRAFEAIGLIANADPIERHAGTLPAALAARGIASVVVPNCWGDLWHNRAGVVENRFRVDGFIRDGRTLAEFAWRFLLEPFPPGNPVTLPVKAQRSRLFMVGLGDGSRAIAELLRLQEDGAFPYRPSAIVADSPEDDLSGYYAPGVTAEQNAYRIGLDRLHEDGVADVASGALSTIPLANLPPRVGVLAPSVDGAILGGSNDVLLEALSSWETAGTTEVWRWTPPVPEHVLSNADPEVAHAVAGFLAEGLDGVDDDLRDDG